MLLLHDLKDRTDPETVNKIIVKKDAHNAIIEEFDLLRSRQAKIASTNFKYHASISAKCTPWLTDVGCSILAVLGVGIDHYAPLNMGALIHLLDNHNCPNGLMTVLAFLLMALSGYKLSFKDAHTIVMEFARKHNPSRGNGSANMMWFQIWTKAGDENQTATIIFNGKYKQPPL